MREWPPGWGEEATSGGTSTWFSVGIIPDFASFIIGGCEDPTSLLEKSGFPSTSRTLSFKREVGVTSLRSTPKCLKRT